jgi:hypothetical protein
MCSIPNNYDLGAGPMYQQNAASVAAARHLPEQSFQQRIQLIARMLFMSTPRASDSDKQFLHDVARAEARFPMRGLERLARIAQQSTRPEHREALTLLVREFSTPRFGYVSLPAAFDEETRTQGIADMEQRRFERERTRINQERAIEALHAQEIATREAIAAVRLTAVQ